MPRNHTIPEFEYREGRLRITEPNRCIWIHGWPEPEAMEQTHGGQWEKYRPPFRLLQPSTPAVLDPTGFPQACDNSHGLSKVQLQRKQEAFNAFRESIPPDFAVLLELFTGHQWNLLALYHERPAFGDLLQANPVLAWCVGNNDQFIRLSAASPAWQARWHIHKRQRELLEWLGFPGTDAALNLMKKIRPDVITAYNLQLLRSALRNKSPALKLLAQLETVNYGALYLACDNRTAQHVTFKLLQMVNQAPAELADAPTAGMIIDSLDMVQQLKRLSGLPPFTEFQDFDARLMFHSTRAVTQLHDRLVRIINRPAPLRRKKWLVKDLPAGHFPPAPFKGTEDILPISTYSALVTEGKEQGNCVAGQSNSIYGGRYYIYRVLKPERATLAIVQENTGFWREHEIKALHNAAVKPETLQAVRSWLWHAQRSS